MLVKSEIPMTYNKYQEKSFKVFFIKLIDNAYFTVAGFTTINRDIIAGISEIIKNER
ncbi:hypothetical protein YN1HA_8450 [Sulfurisphaera ohwakuensis]